MQPVRRKEDPRYLRGEGRFVDDIKLPGMLHAAFVRSPHAHARITAIRTEAAQRLPGVAHVFTFADLERWMKPLPLFGAIPPGPGRARGRDDEAGSASSPCAATRPATWARSWPWCSRAAAPLAEDGCELDRGRLRAAAGAGRRGRARPSRARRVLYPEWGDNIALSFKTGFGDVEAALRQADVRVRERFDDPALRRHADRDARGGRPVGRA